MPHDKIRAAARQRMAQTGESYTAARRAVLAWRQVADAGSPPPGAGYALRMSDEIHDWLYDLRGSDEPAALRVVRALATLMTDGARVGGPLVASTAGSWPRALGVALDRSYHESLNRLAALRRGEADAAELVTDIRDQLAGLEAAQARLAEPPGQAPAAPQQAATAADQLAAIQQQAAQARRLLPRMTEARNRLREQTQQLQARAGAARARKETLKASYAAALGALEASQAMAALDLADGDAGEQPEHSAQTIAAEEARLADIIARMERETGQEAWPEGLMELRPGAPWHDDIRVLFAVEPPGTALLIAVLEGPEAVEDQYPEAVMTSADILRRVRAGQDPEAATHAYDDIPSLLEAFYPGTAAEAGQHATMPEP